jgi:hypothetical protein
MTAASPPTRWLPRITSGDVIDGEHAIAMWAKHASGHRVGRSRSFHGIAQAGPDVRSCIASVAITLLSKAGLPRTPAGTLTLVCWRVAPGLASELKLLVMESEHIAPVN